MIVDSRNMEFGFELFGVIPYAYHHYKRGNLTQTISARDTKPFYYFSPDHSINKNKRNWITVRNTQIPNVSVSEFTGRGEWTAPPYKDFYKNSEFIYDKPTLVISNKYNKEWGHDPVNYLDVTTILTLIDRLIGKYQIFYNRAIPEYLSDDQEQINLGEHEVIRQNFPDVGFIHELPGSYNLNQLMIYANCDKFISVQGGNSVLSSYFGGENIIYTAAGNEIKCKFYERLHMLSGCRIFDVRDYDAVLGLAKSYLW